MKTIPSLAVFIAFALLATMHARAEEQPAAQPPAQAVDGNAMPPINPEKPGRMVDGRLFVAEGADVASFERSVTVATTPKAAFALWTSTAGLKKWFPVDCKIALRVGGPWELYFLPESAPQRGSEGCQILSYLPGRMLSFTWSAPPTMPTERAKRTWVVVEFVDAGEGKTTVRLTHLGFGAGAGWAKVRAYFESAWTNVLGLFAKHYQDEPGKR